MFFNLHFAHPVIQEDCSLPTGCAGHECSRTPAFRYYRFLAIIIEHAVWLHLRFTLTLEMSRDLPVVVTMTEPGGRHWNSGAGDEDAADAGARQMAEKASPIMRPDLDKISSFENARRRMIVGTIIVWSTALRSAGIECARHRR